MGRRRPTGPAARSSSVAEGGPEGDLVGRRPAPAGEDQWPDEQRQPGVGAGPRLVPWRSTDLEIATALLGDIKAIRPGHTTAVVAAGAARTTIAVTGGRVAAESAAGPSSSTTDGDRDTPDGPGPRGHTGARPPGHA